MPKHYKEMMDEIINKMDEDAPVNSVAGGGVDMAPNAKHPLTKSHNKYKKDNEAEDMLRRTIMKKLGKQVKEENDNNNVTLRGVLDNLNKIEKISDEYLGVNEEVKIVEEEKYETFKDKYNA